MFLKSQGMSARPPLFSSTEFRTALGMFATGHDHCHRARGRWPAGGADRQLLQLRFAHPPLVLWSLSHAAASMAVFSSGSHYAVNVLAADQKALAQRFATNGIDRWADVQFVEGACGAPLLAGAAATFECFNRSRYTEGDHVIFVGEVEHCAHRDGTRRCCITAASTTPSTPCNW